MYVMSTFYGLCVEEPQCDLGVYVFYSISLTVQAYMPVVEMSRQLQMNHRHKYDLSKMMCAANTLIWAHNFNGE